MARPPAYQAPSAMLTAAISSSACSTTMPYAPAWRARMNEHPGGRGHGVGGDEVAAAGQGAECHALAAVEQQAVRPGCAGGKRQAAVVFGPGLPAEPGRGQIGCKRFTLAEHALHGRFQHGRSGQPSSRTRKPQQYCRYRARRRHGRSVRRGPGAAAGNLGKEGRVADEQGLSPQRPRSRGRASASRARTHRCGRSLPHAGLRRCAPSCCCCRRGSAT